MNLKTFHFTAKSGLITSTEAVELQDDSNFVSIVHEDWKVIKTIYSFVYPIRYNNFQPTYTLDWQSFISDIFFIFGLAFKAVLAQYLLLSSFGKVTAQ